MRLLHLEMVRTRVKDTSKRLRLSKIGGQSMDEQLPQFPLPHCFVPSIHVNAAPIAVMSARQAPASASHGGGSCICQQGRAANSRLRYVTDSIQDRQR